MASVSCGCFKSCCARQLTEEEIINREINKNMRNMKYDEDRIIGFLVLGTPKSGCTTISKAFAYTEQGFGEFYKPTFDSIEKRFSIVIEAFVEGIKMLAQVVDNMIDKENIVERLNKGYEINTQMWIQQATHLEWDKTNPTEFDPQEILPVAKILWMDQEIRSKVDPSHPSVFVLQDILSTNVTRFIDAVRVSDEWMHKLIPFWPNRGINTEDPITSLVSSALLLRITKCLFDLGLGV